MPITRRRRANPPEQPENNNHTATPIEGTTETPNATQAAPIESSAADMPAPPPALAEPTAEANTQIPHVPTQPAPMSNGDRAERAERGEQPQSYTPAPAIESGRRTARGELFRRPPQVPPVQPAPAPVPVQADSIQPPTHEISLPLGNLLHLSYNPGYTGADEARSALLHKLASESKAGGRARCWNCGSIAIMYDRWSTRNKTFGDVGVAFCEICGVWSVL
ncbi:MAG TPA: hypothetical protein VNG51_11310 [Ktedonobacteraceae bacterium]|nr:hypothetical protein [Ktedonobacteraceae bacterium]